MVTKVVSFLRGMNRSIRFLFPSAFKIEKKFPGGFPKKLTSTHAT